MPHAELLTDLQEGGSVALKPAKAKFVCRWPAVGDLVEVRRICFLNV